MGCCVGAKYGNWCEGEAIVWEDGERNEYCVFHAPAEHKKVNSQEFSDAFFKKIAVY